MSAGAAASFPALLFACVLAALLLLAGPNAGATYAPDASVTVNAA